MERLYFKGRSALYKRLSQDAGFTDVQILKLLGVKQPKVRTKDKINKIFTHEKDYLTLNVCEVLAEAFVLKKLCENTDDAFSLILFDVRICRDKSNCVASENELAIKFARGKMINRKNRIYKTQLDVSSSGHESLFEHSSSDSLHEENN
jgi:hypothetical protein